MVLKIMDVSLTSMVALVSVMVVLTLRVQYEIVLLLQVTDLVRATH
jgi:hypothetical protein